MSASPLHRQVFQSTIALQFSISSLCMALPCNPQRSHAACFAGKIVICEVGSRKRLSGVHRAKKCRNVWGETPCSRAGPHLSGWRSPGRDHLGKWDTVAKGARV